jgi:two-component system sensor kinase FixL
VLQKDLPCNGLSDRTKRLGLLEVPSSGPLGAILSNAEAAQLLLARDPIELSQLHVILSDIVEDDHRAGKIIRRLRALLRRSPTQLQPIDLSDLSSDVLALAHSELVTRNVNVVRRLPSGLPPVHGDQVQLQQVLLNLIVNACDAMSDTSPHDRILTVAASDPGNGTVELMVADHGSGIPTGVRDRLFEPFVSTKTQGLGLGLWISCSIVTAHGGCLWTDNNGEAGAVFHFTLPVAATPVSEGVPPQ